MRARTAMVEICRCLFSLGLLGGAAGQACANGPEPDWAGNNMMAQPENVCDALAVGETCSHQCQSGFSGGSVTCSGQSAAGGTDSAESSCVANGDCAFAEVACTADGGESGDSGSSMDPANPADPAPAQPCDNTEPEWASGNMDSQPADSCDGTADGATCVHTCQSGFSGGSVTCSDGGGSCAANGDCAFTVVACTAAGGESGDSGSSMDPANPADPAPAQPCDNTEPEWASGNMDSQPADSCDGTADGATCVHTCQSGFSGGSVTCSDGGGSCAANGDCAFTVVACTERDAAEPAACPSPSPPPTLCTRPAGDDLAGYVVTENNLEQSNNFDVAVQCDAGYFQQGILRATVCTGGGEYGLEGCTQTRCSTRTGDNPDTYPGYTQLDEVNLQIGGAIGFAVTASCAEGYAGNAVVTACANHGEDYALSGCAAIQCSRPSDTTGYTIGAEHLYIAENLNSPQGPFEVTVGCAQGVGTRWTWGWMTTHYRTPNGDPPEVTPCTSPGAPYSLSGCMLAMLITQGADCTRPAGADVRYELAETDLSIDGFTVTATCKPGYDGTAVVKACDTAGPYEVSGCQPCAPGRFRSDSEPVCTVCPEGQFQEHAGESSCQACPDLAQTPDWSGRP
eukprot:COSAG04_NODE_2058_length_4891_cov_35.546536_1_plen_624_part_10